MASPEKLKERYRYPCASAEKRIVNSSALRTRGGDKRLFITDRKKDMIVMSGWKIYPTEVEEVLIKYPAVKEIAIFSITDCHRGEIPVAAVVWENDADDEGLSSYASENLSRYKVPRKIFELDELPRVNGWKLLRRELRLMFKQ